MFGNDGKSPLDSTFSSGVNNFKNDIAKQVGNVKGSGGGDSDTEDSIQALTESQISLGREWLDFTKEQFANQTERLSKFEEMMGAVVEQQITDAEQAREWSIEDREIARNFLDKYAAQADEDRATGIQFREELNALGNQIQTEAQAAGQELYTLGRDAQSISDAAAQDIRQSGDATAAEMRERGQRFDELGEQAQQSGQEYSQRYDEQGRRFAEQGSEVAEDFRQRGMDYQATGQQYADRFNDQAVQQGDRALASEKRYDETYVPIEERQAREAMEWDSDERLSQRAAEAKAGVLTESENARQREIRQAASMGIDPRSGRYAKMSGSRNQATALASADAQNRARRLTEAEGRDMRLNAINIGRGVEASANQNRNAQTARTGMSLSAATDAQRGGADLTRMGADYERTGQQLEREGTQLSQSADRAGRQDNIAAQGLAGEYARRASAAETDAILNERQLKTAGNQAMKSGVQDKYNVAAGGINQSAGLKQTGLSATGLGNPAGSMSMANQGQGYTGLNASTNLSNSSVGNYGNYINQAGAAGGIVAPGYSGNLSSIGNSINAYGQIQNAEMAKDASNAQMWSGLGNAAGTLGAAWLMASSKHYKENKAPVKGSAVAAIKGMPVESWNYKKGIGDDAQHIGPYAEDFKKATGLGDGKTIAVQDSNGVMIKAIQELGMDIEQLKKKVA